MWRAGSRRSAVPVERSLSPDLAQPAMEADLAGRIPTLAPRAVASLAQSLALAFALALPAPSLAGVTPDRSIPGIAGAYQYRHPQETTHTMSETLDWFAEAGLTFVSSIPKIIGTFSAEERLFEPQSPGAASERFAPEVDMLLSHYGGEGGVYIMIGQKAISR